MENLKIKIHSKHNELGKRGETKLCPTALAVIQATGSKRVMVGASFIWVDENCFEIPKPLRHAIQDFDLGGAFIPCGEYVLSYYLPPGKMENQFLA